MEFASRKKIDITLSNLGNYTALYLLKLKKLKMLFRLDNGSTKSNLRYQTSIQRIETLNN